MIKKLFTQRSPAVWLSLLLLAGLLLAACAGDAPEAEQPEAAAPEQAEEAPAEQAEEAPAEPAEEAAQAEPAEESSEPAEAPAESQAQSEPAGVDAAQASCQSVQVPENPAIASITEGDWTKGPATAAVTVIEYGDFQ